MPILPESNPLHTWLHVGRCVTQGLVSRELKKIKVQYPTVKLKISQVGIVALFSLL